MELSGEIRVETDFFSLNVQLLSVNNLSWQCHRCHLREHHFCVSVMVIFDTEKLRGRTDYGMYERDFHLKHPLIKTKFSRKQKKLVLCIEPSGKFLYISRPAVSSTRSKIGNTVTKNTRWYFAVRLNPHRIH